MKKIVMLAVLAGSASVAMADDILFVDLTVPNTVTITGNAAGLSASTRAVSTFDGVLMANFFNVAGSSINQSAAAGTLTGGAVASNNSPDIFRSAADMGFNLWAWSAAGTANFTAGTVAFTGTASWTVTPAIYAQLIAGNASGNVYGPADTSDDIANASLLGTWRVVPTPGAAAVLGLGGLALGRRRRA